MKKETIEQAKKHAAEDFSYRLNETGDYRDTWRIFRIMSEFVEGYQFLSKFEQEVTIFGSARLPEDNKYYQLARELGTALAKENFTVITGGGPGIMEAANRGATEGNGQSIGLNIQLPFEQRINPYVKQSTAFYYFLTRKVMMISPAHAFVFFPGGFGTMDEFFEVLDLMELNKLCKAPVVLVGKEFWSPIIEFLRVRPMKLGAITSQQIEDINVVETVEEAMNIIKKTKNINTHCELSPKSFKGNNGTDWKIFRIMAELVEGFEFLTGLVEDVTMLGSRSVKRDSGYYKAAHHVATQLTKSGFSVVTGGGIGVAEAANKGCKEAGGESIGISMPVKGKTKLNEYVTKSIVMKFPFTRKLIVTAPSKAFIFFPGGLGTLHQLFEVLTLIQTKKMQHVPVILYDHDFWQPLHGHIKKMFVHQLETISDEDDELYTIVDDEDSIIKIVQAFRNIN